MYRNDESLHAAEIDGVLMQSRGSVFGETVFYCSRGIRRSVRNASRISELGFIWPDDLKPVPEAVLKAFLPGGIVPGSYPNGFRTKGITSSLDMRELLGSSVYGYGLEIGAGSSPFPVALGATVRYADIFPFEVLRRSLYPGQNPHDLVCPEYVTNIKTLAGIPDSSFDFIVACHVIEHTNNPIAAIESCYRVLRSGGTLILVVPDMTRTFDRKRELTSLSHLIEDYESPSEERDLAHYVDFYTNAFPVPSGTNILEHAVKQQRDSVDIHYHTFDYK